MERIKMRVFYWAWIERTDPESAISSCKYKDFQVNIQTDYTGIDRFIRRGTAILPRVPLRCSDNNARGDPLSTRTHSSNMPANSIYHKESDQDCVSNFTDSPISVTTSYSFFTRPDITKGPAVRSRWA
jgi:hypothetical protein